LKQRQKIPQVTANYDVIFLLRELLDSEASDAEYDDDFDDVIIEAFFC